MPEDPASPSSSLVLAAREGSFPIVFSSPQTRALWGGGGEERREERNSSANLPSTQVRLKFLPGPLSPEDAYSRTIWPAARLMKIKTAVTSSETVLTIILAGLRDPERRPRGGRETAGRRVRLGTQAGSCPASGLHPGPPGPQRPALSRESPGHAGRLLSGLLPGPPGPQRPALAEGHLGAQGPGRLGAAPMRVLWSPVPAGGAATLTASSLTPRAPDPKRNPARRPSPVARLPPPA